MKKRFLLLLCALLALPVFASAGDVLMLSGAALDLAGRNNSQADDSLIITETITDEEENVRHRAVPLLERPSSGGLYPAG